jgi:hypothetical protein
VPDTAIPQEASDTLRLACPRCGIYLISGKLLRIYERTNPDEKRQQYSCAIRERTNNALNTELYDDTSLESLLVAPWPDTPKLKTERLLINLTKMSPHPGAEIDITPSIDSVLAFTFIREEIDHYLSELSDREYIRVIMQTLDHVKLSIRNLGYEYAKNVLKNGKGLIMDDSKKRGEVAIKTISFETTFDAYSSMSIIGEGGAGRVYAVRNTAGEELALKCLAPEHITLERLMRFKHEVQFCQNQDHINIVKVEDYGTTTMKGKKCPFYVMKRYSGTLRTLMSKLKLDEIMPLLSQILDGVEMAHLSQVWHRDLKPENILFDKSHNHLLVADFGIAHFEDEEIYTAVDTKETAKMANFQYSAPEQRKRGGKVDHRADIFALGLILNELFTGEIPQGTGYKKIATVNQDFAYLDELVESMIKQDPADRPGSIAEIKKELIGRKNAFIALQKYDELTKRVVKTTEPPEFEPIRIVSFDYASGNLELKFDRPVPQGWEKEFKNPLGGYTSMLGYEPERFNFRNNTVSIKVREDANFIQELINYAKGYVNSANRDFVQQMRENARREEEQQRTALEKNIAEAERRKNILANIKL